ncbi:DUF6119 family protein [Senegalimassilia anaerobia]|uniref:Sporadically distributed protein, TIGR04141 family n=1 Tax=Senegalimassilia anaerobia TaxID=1473216 RepID=A0A369LD37_9ACTN|nr:DUF6119 family protein [Senegalimassilia anaerobia]RDB57551.1 hypothetical protein C1880_01675 [Senegalimassilia anaerobia]
MAKIKSSIYLLKPEVKQPEECIGPNKDVSKHETDNGGIVFYKRSVGKTPQWLTSFFPKLAELDELKTTSASAVYVIPVETEDGIRLFALSFGYGRTMLDESCYVERFGLKTLLNIVEDDSIRKITRTTVAGNALKTAEQLPKRSPIEDFGIDVERDLLNGVTAALPEDSPLSGNANGSDALSIGIPDDLKLLPDTLKTIYGRYVSDGYKAKFPWVDNIAAVKSKATIEKLNELAIRKIKEHSPDIWMAVPDVVEWEHIAGFKFPGLQELCQDIVIDDFLASLTNPLAEFEQLKSKKITAIGCDNDEAVAGWPASQCLYGEIELKGTKYCINGGKWYQVENSFAERIETSYRNCEVLELPFPKCEEGMRESDYNVTLAASDKGHYALMDAKNISYGGGQSKIELCDVLTDDGRFIHIKKYSGSAVLSHLFNQGYVSTMLVKSDAAFRNKASKILSETNPSFTSTLSPDSVKEVVYGIITKDDVDRPRLPFFSKVTLDAVRSNLLAMGAKVSVKAIHLSEG